MNRQDNVPNRSTAAARRKALCFTALLFAASHPAHAAVTQAWVQRDKSPAIRIAAGHAVAFDVNGDVVMAGVSLDSTARNSESKFHTIKYSWKTGALIWEKTHAASSGFLQFPLPIDDGAIAVATDAQGDVVVTGSSLRSWQNYDIYTAKYAGADGALLWERQFNGPGNSNDMATALVLDAVGNAIVTGYSYNTNGNRDFYTTKYSATNGAVLWDRFYDGPAPVNNADEAHGVAVDGAGNVIVTGYSIGLQGNWDCYTAKYDGADGSLVWDKRYNGPANHSDYANAVAVDVGGNVFVTGGSTDAGFSFDLYTAKYAGDTGALLWEKRYDSPVGLGATGRSLAVDVSGNVVVTGGSFRDNNNTDFYTAKYSGMDGSLLWEVRYAGTGDGPSYGEAVILDAVGNPIVTGNSWGGTSQYDYYTAKYSSVNGARLWEKRYGGTIYGDDSPVGKGSLAISPNGQIAVTGSSALPPSPFTVWATVLYKDNLFPLQLNMIVSGVRLRFDGTPGNTYQIQRALSASGPWSAIATLVAPVSGLVEHTDTNRPSGTAFYRTRAP